MQGLDLSVLQNHVQAILAAQNNLGSSPSVKPLTEAELQLFVAERKRLAKRKKQTVCVFCKNNGEIEAVFISHTLKVSCPKILHYLTFVLQRNASFFDDDSPFFDLEIFSCTLRRVYQISKCIVTLMFDINL